MKTSFLFSAFVSLGFHSLVVLFFLSFPSKVSRKEPFSIEIVWEKKPCAVNQVVSLKTKEKLKKKNSTRTSPTASLHKKDRHTFSSASSVSGEGKKEKRESIQKTKGRRAYHPLPAYPWICRKRGQEGAVSLKIKTDEEGKVTQARLGQGSGHQRLDRAALDVIKDWVFTEENAPKTITISFHLSSETKIKFN